MHYWNFAGMKFRTDGNGLALHDVNAYLGQISPKGHYAIQSTAPFHSLRKDEVYRARDLKGMKSGKNLLMVTVKGLGEIARQREMDAFLDPRIDQARTDRMKNLVIAWENCHMTKPEYNSDNTVEYSIKEIVELADAAINERDEKLVKANSKIEEQGDWIQLLEDENKRLQLRLAELTTEVQNLKANAKTVVQLDMSQLTERFDWLKGDRK